MNWRDPADVAALLEAHPDALYACARYDAAKPEGKRTCLRELTLEGGIFRCPVHGKEIAECI